MTAPAAPVLAADLNAGLKRLKMAAMRRLAPELLDTAKRHRWSREEFLRALVEAEITARDASNAATRRRQAGFPVTKTLDDYDLTASSVQQATFDYLASLEWIRAAENVCLIGPAGPGKSIGSSWRLLKPLLAGGIVAGLLAMTWSRANVWGNTHDQALLWARLNPASARAQAFAAQAELAAGHPERAIDRLEPALKRAPGEVQLALNLVAARCALGDLAHHGAERFGSVLVSHYGSH